MDRDREEEVAPLCVKGCGFYGSPENLNMCSKCYRDHKKKKQEEEEEEEIAAALLLMSNLDIKKGDAVEEEKKGTGTGTTTGDDQAAAPPRCVRCNKKVSMYGFKCRCGSVCCSRHRYPEEHRCTFDFKTAGRISLAKANVLVKPDKLEDRII